MARMKFIDASNVREQIEQWGPQILAGYQTNVDFTPYKLPPFANYVVCGMGGSSLAVDILHDFLDDGVHIYVGRSYTLPKETNERSLVVVVSYSGNTEESLACYKEARKRKLPLIAMAHGGKLSELAKRDEVPFIEISNIGVSQPRYSSGYQLGYHARILEMHGLIEPVWKRLVAGCKEAERFHFEDEGYSLAKKIYKTYPLFYIDSEFGSVARVSHIKVSENSKMLSHWNVLPEMNHNEMNGFMFSQKQGKFSAVLVTSRLSHPRINKRFHVLAELMKKYGIKVYSFEMQGKTRLAQMLSAIEYLDWVSFYLSQMNKIDPSPVDIVEEFKKALG